MWCMAKRLSVTLEAADEGALIAFADPDRAEHAALAAWAVQHGLQLPVSPSEAALIRLLLRVGIESLHEKALDEGYAQLAASLTDEERADSRAARDRYADRAASRRPA
jgi:hypothetical protein